MELAVNKHRYGSRKALRVLASLPIALAVLTVPVLARAAVAEVAATGFTVQLTSHIAAPADKIFAVLIAPARWWSSDHTFSGSSSNLTLEAKAGGCWCETLPGGGSVQHLTVIYVAPGKALRLRGALGPLQGMGVNGAMTWSLKPQGQETELSLTYVVGGHDKDGFDALSKAVDGVLSEQLGRLQAVAEGRSPDRR
jgi:uncharacterized protein YndB with AHSA1/START domain